MRTSFEINSSLLPQWINTSVTPSYRLNIQAFSQFKLKAKQGYLMTSHQLPLVLSTPWGGCVCAGRGRDLRVFTELNRLRILTTPPNYVRSSTNIGQKNLKVRWVSMVPCSIICHQNLTLQELWIFFLIMYHLISTLDVSIAVLAILVDMSTEPSSPAISESYFLMEFMNSRCFLSSSSWAEVCSLVWSFCCVEASSSRSQAFSWHNLFTYKIQIL